MSKVKPYNLVERPTMTPLYFIMVPTCFLGGQGYFSHIPQSSAAKQSNFKAKS